MKWGRAGRGKRLDPELPPRFLPHRTGVHARPSRASGHSQQKTSRWPASRAALGRGREGLRRGNVRAMKCSGAIAPRGLMSRGGTGRKRPCWLSTRVILSPRPVASYCSENAGFLGKCEFQINKQVIFSFTVKTSQRMHTNRCPVFYLAILPQGVGGGERGHLATFEHLPGGHPGGGGAGNTGGRGWVRWCPCRAGDSRAERPGLRCPQCHG